MTRIYVQTIKSKSGKTSVSFVDPISANGVKQWLDTYGVIKTNGPNVNEDVTIPVGTNAVSVGSIKVGVGNSVTVQGDWRIL